MNNTVLFTVLLSLVPISELRGSIPFAYFNGINLFQAFCIAVLSNAMVAPIAMIFFSTLHKILDKWGFYHRVFEKTVSRARAKVESKIEKYGYLGLLIFVAIPLPVTGAWTGSLGAWVLGLNKTKSILFIGLGVLIAGIIVSAVLLSGVGISSIFIKNIG